MHGCSLPRLLAEPVSAGGYYRQWEEQKGKRHDESTA